MIKVTMGNNLDRTSVIVKNDQTIRETLDKNGISYTSGVMHLNGAPLRDDDFDKTFEELGVRNDCYLLSVAKAQNA